MRSSTFPHARGIPRPSHLCAMLGTGLLVCSCLAWSQGAGDVEQRTETKMTDEEAIAYKLTPTLYLTTNQRTAYDVNVRANRGAQTGWVGFYQRSNEFQQ